MKDARKQLEALLKEGETFTYDNFAATHTHNGYPSHYSAEWLAWTTRVQAITERLFDEKAASTSTLEAGLKTRVLGNGAEHFDTALSYIVTSLKTSIAAIDQDTFHELGNSPTSAPKNFSTKVFVVHGHDNAVKGQLEVFLNEIGLEPVVLHRQPDEGQTVIEKFEKSADVGYAFVILTPDEIAYLVKYESLPEDQRVKERRSRPNVIFEFGYFVGKLGRKRVCTLYSGDVVLPSDLAGLVYKKFDKSLEEIGYAIIKELKAAGYTLKI